MTPILGQILHEKLLVKFDYFLVASLHHSDVRLVEASNAALEPADRWVTELTESFASVVKLLELDKSVVEVLKQRPNFSKLVWINYLLIVMLQGPMFCSKNSDKSR